MRILIATSAVVHAPYQLITTDLTTPEREQVAKLVQQLAKRVYAELWADEMGWTIPPYGTPEWQELYTAWLESEDE